MSEQKTSAFEVLIADDPDYKDLIAEIEYEGRCICLITQEKGYDHLEVEILRIYDNTIVFPLADFEAAIERAKRRLSEMRKV